MLIKNSTAQITVNTKRVSEDSDVDNPKIASGIVQCHNCGKVYLVAHGSCPDCKE